MTAVTFYDAHDFALSWVHPEPRGMERGSHALRDDGGRVWVIDPADGEGVEERIRALGEPAGVVQLLDRHNRDCAALAERLGVAHYRVPFEGIPGAPFEVLGVLRLPLWKEVALWWPQRRTLAIAEAVGSARYYCAPGERLAAHAWLRLIGPPGRLDELRPQHVLCGHGPPVHEEADEALRAAVHRSRSTSPSWALARARDLLPFGR